ncbi:MAG: ATP-binding protein [Bacteroidales bacterium]|nr:ATP-binding protein [Bacteroidales bacterium]
MMIKRNILDKINEYSNIFPVIAIIGPRQVGKTTFVKYYAGIIDKESVYLDLEKPSDFDKLENAEFYLSQHKGKCIIIDEVQNKPDLFPLIRSIVDENNEKCNFIILGSASPELLKQSSETLAGRIGYIELGPFSAIELKDNYNFQKHFFGGGFPLSYLSPNEKSSKIWLNNFIKTYLEKDLPLLGLKAKPQFVRRLWEMLTWQTGSLLNYNAIAKSLSVSNHTIYSYIDFLEGAFMLTLLKPYFYNIKKRIIKSPKIYINDTGILHRLLRLNDYDQLLGNPLLGNSWETFVVNQINLEKNEDIDLFFYRTHAGAEVDLVFVKGMKPIATAEIKFSLSPKISKGLINSIETLNSNNNFIIIPQGSEYKIRENIKVCAFNVFIEKYLNAL